MTRPISWTSFKCLEILLCLVSTLHRWQRAIKGSAADSGTTVLNIEFDPEVAKSKKNAHVTSGNFYLKKLVKLELSSQSFYFVRIFSWHFLGESRVQTWGTTGRFLICPMGNRTHNSWSNIFQLSPNAMKALKMRRQMALRFVSSIALTAGLRTIFIMTLFVMTWSTGFMQEPSTAFCTGKLTIRGCENVQKLRSWNGQFAV